MNNGIYIDVPLLVIIIITLTSLTIICILQFIKSNSHRNKADEYRFQAEQFNQKIRETELIYENTTLELQSKIRSQLAEFNTKINEQTLDFAAKEAELKVKYQSWALEQFETFKKNEIQKLEEEHKQNALKLANLKLQEWKVLEEAEIRKDAINRSYAVNLGKITEHLIPFHQVFLASFNPKDARFIGSPIDLIVFDGYSEKTNDITIYLVEIKTGGSKLNDNQRRVRNAIENGRVRWAEINPDNIERVIEVRNSEFEIQETKTHEESENTVEVVVKNMEFDREKILEVFTRYISKGNNQNQSMNLTCKELQINQNTKDWSEFKKSFLSDYYKMT